jgi:hypothetical protein
MSALGFWRCYEEFIGAKKHLVLSGMLSNPGPEPSNSFGLVGK